MTVSIDQARSYVYANGSLWERALFSHLFDGGSLERVHKCLLPYQNEDGGFGHGLESDIKCPDSHPLALEFLLSVLVRDMGISVGNVLDGATAWVEQNRAEDGSLKNPSTLLQYPHAPWWSQGGQTAPDSITGNLHKVGLASASLLATTQKWVEQNLTLEKIAANEWLFMAYHAYDYFMNVDEFPNVEAYREATIANIVKCAESAPEKQYFVLFQFAPTPESPVAQAMPKELLDKFLAYLETSQREDGGWDDEHGLAYWQPYFTIKVLWTLKKYNRL